VFPRYAIPSAEKTQGEQRMRAPSPPCRTLDAGAYRISFVLDRVLVGTSFIAEFARQQLPVLRRAMRCILISCNSRGGSQRPTPAAILTCRKRFRRRPSELRKCSSGLDQARGCTAHADQAPPAPTHPRHATG